MATYGPGIDQSQHAKSVSHIIKTLITLTIIIINVSVNSHKWSFYTVVRKLKP